MDLWQLDIFCKVVELKSFSQAGKTVHLSQPTVSSHIKDLETHFGCRLIDRLAREALPTRAGRLLYRYARRIIRLRDETEAALAEFKGAIKGRLTVAGSTIPGGYILPSVIGSFSRKYPEVTVSLAIGDTQKIIERILAGELELGVVGARSGDKRIRQEKLVPDEMRLVVPSDHKWSHLRRIQFSMLAGEPFVAREPGSGTLKSIQDSLQQKGFGLGDLNIIAEMGSTEAVRQAIKGNVGVSILSTTAVAEEISAGRLTAVGIDDIDLKRWFYLTCHRHRTLSPLSNAFLAFLEQVLGAPPATA